MHWFTRISFESPHWMEVGITLVFAIVAVAMVRRVRVRSVARLSIAGGVILLALTAGQPVYRRPTAGVVTVMVDLSPSTRGATFRDKPALLGRIQQLLGDYQYDLIAFSDHNQPLPDELTDLKCDHTLFDPPPAEAVLLFSDGRFDLPAYAPPVYPVIDPALDHPADAAVTDLKFLGKQVLATVHHDDPPRPLQWTGAIPRASPSSGGDFTELATPTGSSQISASLPPQDLWPENDSLSIIPPPPVKQEQWWIGNNSPSGWQKLDPANLPMDLADYLRPSVVVLNNIPADALSSAQQQQLLQYVRDLGGSLVLVGGDHAFAAGHYDGTDLDDLSPLSSSPPTPSMQWILLIDSSGSMAGDGSIPSPWQTEVTAVTRLLPQLPGHDAVSIGSFADSLKWWSTGKSAIDTRLLQLPPPNTGPNGPTNLESALKQIATTADATIPSQLLLMTDADTDLPNPDALGRALAAKRIHLHLLAIGHGSALPALQSIASQTNGSVIEQLDARRWITSATLLLRSAMPDRYHRQPMEITRPPHRALEWNQTWMKSTATALESSSEFTMTAQWQLGLGKVTAIAYPADANRIASFAAQIAAEPGDPRFTVTWNTGSSLEVEVHAIDVNTYLNGLSIQLQMFDPESQLMITQQLPQTAPGQYQITLPSPRTSQLITVLSGPRVLRRFAIAGRYPPEFDRIGNDRQNLQALADRTGGSVINPGPAQPIQFSWPTKRIPLSSEFAFAGFAAIALGLAYNQWHAGK